MAAQHLSVSGGEETMALQVGAQKLPAAILKLEQLPGFHHL